MSFTLSTRNIFSRSKYIFFITLQLIIEGVEVPGSVPYIHEQHETQFCWFMEESIRNEICNVRTFHVTPPHHKRK